MQQTNASGRLQIQILTTVEFDIVPENYPKSVRNSLKKMLAMDIAGAKSDPQLFLSLDDARIKVRGKVIDAKISKP